MPADRDIAASASNVRRHAATTDTKPAVNVTHEFSTDEGRPSLHPADPELATTQELRQWTAAYASSLVALENQVEGEFVLFRLGEELFAVPIEDLDQVANITSGMAIAHASPIMLGLTSLRGEILPLLDTAALLGTSANFSLGVTNRTLIVRDRRGRRSGLPVDAVVGVASFDRNTVRNGSARPGEGLIARVGIAEHDGEALTLVDITPLQRETLEQF